MGVQGQTERFTMMERILKCQFSESIADVTVSTTATSIHLVTGRQTGDMNGGRWPARPAGIKPVINAMRRRFDCPSAVPVCRRSAASPAQNGWKTTERLPCLAGPRPLFQTFNHDQLQPTLHRQPPRDRQWRRRDVTMTSNYCLQWPRRRAEVMISRRNIISCN